MSLHDCPGCHNVKVPRSKLSCNRCWHRVPLKLRRELNASPGDPTIIVDILEWYREHPA